MKAVVFDLDGTLIDSLPDVLGALNPLLRDLNRRPITVEEGVGMVGGGAEPLIARAFAATGDAVDPDRLGGLVRRFLDNYAARPAVETRVYDGVLPVLDGLIDSGSKLGICTNKPHAMAQTVLEALDLTRYFGACYGKGVLGFNKPDRRHYDRVAADLGVDPADSVYVGDSETDVATARNAGVPVVLVSFGYSLAPAATLGADALIDRFSELPAALAGLAPAPLRAAGTAPRP